MGSVGAPARPLAPFLAELKLIHGPHSPLLTLHPNKALVQAQIVADGILWKEDQPGMGQVSGLRSASPVSTDLLLSHIPLNPAPS